MIHKFIFLPERVAAAAVGSETGGALDDIAYAGAARNWFVGGGTACNEEWGYLLIASPAGGALYPC